MIGLSRSAAGRHRPKLGGGIESSWRPSRQARGQINVREPRFYPQDPLSRRLKPRNELRNDLPRGSIDGVDSNRPRDGQKPSKPGSLLFPVATSADLDPLHGLLQPESPSQVLAEFSIPDRFDRLRTKPTGFIETSNLLEKTRVHHGPNSSVDSTIEQFRGPIQHHDPDRRAAADRCAPLGLMLGQGPPGDRVDFQGPDHPASVVGMNSLGRCRVDLDQSPVQ